jgi:hypothetical protein
VALLPNRFLARRYKRVRGFAAPGLCAPFNSNVECLLPQLSKDCSGHELPLVDAPIRDISGSASMLCALWMLAACESPTMATLISTAKHAKWSKHEFDSARG